MPGKPSFFFLSESEKGDQRKANLRNKKSVFLCSAKDRDGSAKLERFHNSLEYSRLS